MTALKSKQLLSDGTSSNSTSSSKPSEITPAGCSIPKSYRAFLSLLEHLILCLLYSHYCIVDFFLTILDAANGKDLDLIYFCHLSA